MYPHFEEKRMKICIDNYQFIMRSYCFSHSTRNIYCGAKAKKINFNAVNFTFSWFCGTRKLLNLVPWQRR